MGCVAWSHISRLDLPTLDRIQVGCGQPRPSVDSVKISIHGKGAQPGPRVGIVASAVLVAELVGDDARIVHADGQSIGSRSGESVDHAGTRNILYSDERRTCKNRP